MKPYSPVPPRKNKNVVTVGELKRKVAELKDENLQMEGMMKADGESDPEYLKRISANNSAISRYSKMIAKPSAYKPKK